MPLTPRGPFLGKIKQGSCLLSALYLLAGASLVVLADRYALPRETSQRPLLLALVLLVLSAAVVYSLLVRLRRQQGWLEPAPAMREPDQAAEGELQPAGDEGTQRSSASSRARYRELELQALRLLAQDQPAERGVQTFMQLICDQLGFSLAEWWVADEGSAGLRLASQWRSLALRDAHWLRRDAAFRLSRGESLPGRVWAKNKVRWERDLRALEPAAWPGEGGERRLRTAIGIPASADPPVEGVVVFGSTAVLDLDSSLRQTLSALGRQLGLFLARAYAHARLQDEEQRYRSLVVHALGQTNVGKLVLDRDYKVRWASDKLLDDLQADLRTTLGMSARELLERAGARGMEWTAGFTEALLASYDDGSYLEGYETSLRSAPSAPEQWLEYSSRPILEGYFQGGRIEYFVDITRRKRIQLEARRRAQQQAGVADLGMRALTDLDLEALRHESVQVLARDLGVQFAGWFELSSDGRLLQLKAGVGWGGVDQEWVELPADVDTHPGYTLFSSAPVIVEDFFAESRFHRSPWIARYGIRSGLGVALQVRERPIGVLAAYASSTRSYSEHDLIFARSIANVLAGAIDRSQSDESLRRAREELELRIEVRTQELSSANRALQAEIQERQRAEDSARGLLRIAQRLTRNLDPDALLDELVRECMRLVGAGGGCAGLRGERSLSIRKLFVAGDELPAEYAWPRGSGLAGWVLEHRKPYATDEAEQDAQIDPEFRERFGIRSAICFPILDPREEVMGFFELHNTRSEGGWSEFDRERLAAVSRIASIAFQNALAYRALKLAEGQLTSSTAQLEEAQRIAQIGSWEWDLETDRLTWSNELYRIYGLDPKREGITVERFVQLVHPDERGLLQQRMEQAHRDHQPFSIEHRILTAQGESKVLHSRGTVILDPAGKPVRMVGTGQDITAAKSMEEALIGQSHLYESLVEAQSDLGLGVVVAEGGKIVYANQALVELSGYTQAELAALPAILELVVPEQRSEVQAYLEAVATGAAADHCDAVIRHRNGQRRNIEFSAKLASSRAGDRIFGIVRDVTLRTQAVERLRRSEEQMRQFSAYLEEAREQERGKIAREIHDELGQALTGLKMDVSWIEQRLAGGEFSGEIDRLQGRARAMSELIDVTVQAVRRIATELRPGVLDDLGLIPAIEWQVGEFTKRTGIACSLVSNIEDLELDRRVATGAFRIVQEALTNVARHSQATKVKIRIKATNGTFQLEVEDNGVGMQQGASSGPRSLGILGMQERAHLLGGEVQFEQGPEQGTRVRLRLPTEVGGEEMDAQ